MCVAGFSDGTWLPRNNLQYSFCLFSAGIIGPHLPGFLVALVISPCPHLHCLLVGGDMVAFQDFRHTWEECDPCHPLPLDSS